MERGSGLLGGALLRIGSDSLVSVDFVRPNDLAYEAGLCVARKVAANSLQGFLARVSIVLLHNHDW